MNTDSRSLIHELRAVIDGEVSDSTRRRAEYSSDASNYRVIPRVVVVPRTVDDIVATCELARSAGVPITARGAGTSVAGNAVGPGVVFDTSRWLDQVVSIDPEARTATVQPGVILDVLQARAAVHGLRFGPDPSTHARCTIGGMIGNNACGPHAVAYGRTADNVISLDVLDGRGRRFTAGNDSAGTGVKASDELSELVERYRPVISGELGRFPRQVSGYSLEHLLAENGGDLAKALVGTEGTCGVVLEATVGLVPAAEHTALVVLGFPTMIAAADHVPEVLAHDPLAVEGIDSRLVEVVRRARGPGSVPPLPEGAGWLLVEFGGSTEGEARAKAANLRRKVAAGDAVVTSGTDAARLWRIRDDGAGLAGRTPAGHQAWPGWEDAAVPPERLGSYLRDFERLLDRFGLDGLLYGHFGDGCVHVRLDLPLDRSPQVLRPFLLEAARVVTANGGSLSGEHGDGRARSELLPIMYSRDAIDCFEAFKTLFDPDDLLNPGVVVEPRPVDADLRRPAAVPLRLAQRAGGFALNDDGGDLTRALHRCVGVGKCRIGPAVAGQRTGTVMCPSFLVSSDETDSTRGRARVLQEMVNGELIGDRFAAPEVAEALELCLSCKACRSDCPAGVDMATYKSEVLYHRYRHRRRPRSHYVLGQLPRWLRLATMAPTAANLFLAPGLVRRLLLRAAGMDPRREVPRLASQPWRRVAGKDRTEGSDRPDRPPVVLWVDSFTDAFDPRIASSAVRVLEAAGYRVVPAGDDACCGLSWITTGQLDGARRRLGRTLDALWPLVDQGMKVVGLEPSCLATLRQDLPELLADDERSQPVAEAVMTLAEFLTEQPGRNPARRWTPPRLDNTTIIAQPHCHHHSVMGYRTDLALLSGSGAEVSTVAGCCGLAGNFGMERGHYEVSVAIARQGLLPALEDAPDGAVFLADGFSCRTQARQLAGATGVHLARLLADALDDERLRL